VISLTPGRSLAPLELLEFMAPRMAHFMLPRFIRILPELPKTPTAKIEKHRLKAEGITPDTWDREAHGIKVNRKGLQTGV
ncbi:MAG TPA: hypothetical protein VFG52_00705, partial [Xanthomonadales bacterium]|nr:hypothetical protein [Xanthomonadales bacterium]